MEIGADDIGYARAHETLYRFGRAYPTYWTPDGLGGHCLRRAEWLDDAGKVLAASGYEPRDKYLSYACRFRSPCISGHWEFLLNPMVLHHPDRKGRSATGSSNTIACRCARTRVSMIRAA